MFKKEILIVILFMSLSQSTIINTEHGPVLGAIRETETGRTYHSFQGIPYAQPPDGPLRFRVSICVHLD